MYAGPAIPIKMEIHPIAGKNIKRSQGNKLTAIITKDFFIIPAPIKKAFLNTFRFEHSKDAITGKQ